MTTHSGIHDWRIPWAEEPGGLQSMGSQRVRHDGVRVSELQFMSYSSSSPFLIKISVRGTK